MNRKKVAKSSDLSVNLRKCKNERKLDYLTASPGCSEDLAAVSVLPEQWLPRKGGPILLNYLKQQEQSHQSVLLDLLKDSKKLNEQINGEVRILAEVLLADIQQNQREIDCVIEECTPSENSLAADESKKALTQINTLLSRRIQDLNKFKVEAFSLERKRAAGLKNVLRMSFQRLVGVGHKPPKDLLHDFDERIYDINQQLMSNSRTYMVLDSKLRIQADDSLTRARSMLNQMFLVVRKTSRSQSAYPCSSNINRSNTTASPQDNKQNVVDLYQDTQNNRHSQSKLIEGFKETVFKMFTVISDQFDELYKEVKENNNITRKCSMPAITELQKIIERAIHSLGLNTSSDDCLHRNSIEISPSIVLNMQKILTTFGENLKSTYFILHDAIHLWDDHMVRLALAQKLTMASVEDLIVNNDAIELANEVFINIAIEQLRAAPDADKLQQYYDVIEVALNRATDVYAQHREIEMSKLDEFINFNSFLIPALLAEFNLFLEKNPKSPLPEVKNAVNTSLTGLTENKDMSSRLPISKAIFQTEVQNVALLKWRNGFLESFESNMPTLSVQLNQQTQLWVDERTDILGVRHTLKLMSHSIRKERIDVACEIRQAEIRYHESRLNSHLDAIYDLVDNLPTEASEIMSLDAPELYPLGRWLFTIQNDINMLYARDPLDPEVKRLKMCSYAARLIKHRQQFLDSLDVAIDQYRKSIEYKIQVARISNVRFMTQLQLFSEGGKYAASEAMRTCTALARGAEALETCFSRTMDCVNHRRSHLLSFADQQILPIQKVVDEALKNAPKGFLDKKKIVSTKK